MLKGYLQIAETISDAPFDGVEYEDRIVAFVDILGWGEAIEKSAHSRAVTSHLGFVLKLLGNYQEPDLRTFTGDPTFPKSTFRVTQFSDSIVMSWANMPDSDEKVVWGLEQLRNATLNYGLFLRGGIAAGPFYHTPNVLFGPALLAAHKLESKVAVFPRILLHQGLIDRFDKAQDVRDETGHLYARRKSWRLDHDGHTFFDYMQPFSALQVIDPTKTEWSNSMDFFPMFRAAIEENLSEYADDPRVLRKYVWAVEYFNAVIAEYPEKKVAAIPLKFPGAFDARWTTKSQL